MFDIGWAELLLIGFIVLLAVGPNDIPKAMYQAGRFFRRLQYMRFALGQQFDDFMEKAEAAQQPRPAGQSASGQTVAGQTAPNQGEPAQTAANEADVPEEPVFEPGDPANPAFVAHDEEMDEDMIAMANLPHEAEPQDKPSPSGTGGSA